MVVVHVRSAAPNCSKYVVGSEVRFVCKSKLKPFLRGYWGNKEMLGREFFDPERSTTHDVVRHAIIPMSLQGVLPAEEGEEILLWTEDAGVTFESTFERRSCIKPTV